ncbi:MAG TPA: TIGR03752 family integrating conjugative element protein [Woeseiaceae bacterium]|nr:TIGR03752 family integrating conjugative element protein [Woeseiaceae bacterium]
MRANRLLPMLALAFIAVTVLVMVRGCDSRKASPLMTTVPSVPRPDADSPADTIRTLTANVAGMTAELKNLRRENEALMNDNQRLAKTARNTNAVTERQIADALKAQRERDATSTREQSTRLDALTRRLETLDRDLASTNREGDGLPVGFGLLPGENASDDWHWIAPIDRERDAGTSIASLARLDQRTDSTTMDAPAWPVYTIPRNATLLGATALTALVGRVPRDGQVQDPMPFKLITGSDNLAANGHRVPGVSGMIWSGTAFGDWTLGCVTGRVHSVTFVFDDGTVRTVSSDTRQTLDDGDDRPLGWISDDRGIPCVAGSRKTNAPEYLKQRIAVQVAAAGAQAAAAAETTSVIGTAGTVTDRVNGDIARFMLGKSVAGGAQEIADWLDEHQAQNFDAVFVPAGQTLALHVDREIPIDYLPLGRRLTHERHNDARSYPELD